MLEIQINSNEYTSKSKNPCFDMSINYADIKETHKLFRGAYLKNYNCNKSLEQKVVMKSLFESDLHSHTDVVILDCCKLYTKESDIQKQSREALQKFIGKPCEEKEYSLTEEISLMKIVKESLEKLDSRKINDFVPFNVNTVVVIAQDSSELDGILHCKYKKLDSWHAPNKVKFNFYVI